MNKPKLKFREKLEKLASLKEKIKTVAKPIYEEHAVLQAECIQEFLKVYAKKGKEEISGILTAPLSLKFKDGTEFVLKPDYINKEGDFRNTVWKAAGPDVFTITKITPNRKEKSEK